MRTLALPIRINRDGQLERADAHDTLLRMIQAMVGASSGSWSRFGLHEQFAQANLALQDQQRLTDALNAALDELGVNWARVHSVRTSALRQPEERRFDITLTIDVAQTVHGSLIA